MFFERLLLSQRKICVWEFIHDLWEWCHVIPWCALFSWLEMETAAVAFSELPRGCHDGDLEGWLSLDRKYVSVTAKFLPLVGHYSVECVSSGLCCGHGGLFSQAVPLPGPSRPRLATQSPPWPLPWHQYIGHGEPSSGSLSLLRASCVGPWLTRVESLAALRSRLWQHLMGVPGQRSRGAWRRCHLDSLIGEALIWMMSEVEPPHWLQRDTRITERDCRRGERTLNLCHTLLPKWLPSWGALWCSYDLQGLFSESVGMLVSFPQQVNSNWEFHRKIKDGDEAGKDCPTSLHFHLFVPQNFSTV